MRPEAVTVVHRQHQHTLLLPAGDHITRALRAGRFYEHHMLEFVESCEATGVYLDIGAHCGNHAVFFAAHCPATHVIAVEPDPETFSLLRANTSSLPSIECVNAAVMETHGRARIERPQPGNTGMNYAVADSNGDITAVTAGALVSGCAPLAVVKLDLEGAECAALRSLVRRLEVDAPMLLVEAQTADALAAHREILGPLGYQVTRCFNATPTYVWLPRRDREALSVG